MGALDGPRGAIMGVLRRRSVKSVLMLAGGTSGGQALVILVTPLLTRLYAPDDFGLLAAFLAIMSPVLAVSSLRFELAVPLPEDDAEASALVALSLGLVAVTSLLAWGAVYLGQDALAAWLNVPTLGGILWLLPVGLVAAGGYKVLSYWAVRVQAFPSLARTKLAQGVGAAVAQIGLGLAGAGGAGLVAGDIVGRASGSGTLGVLMVRSARWRWEGIRVAAVARAARAYRRYATMMGPASLLNIVTTQLPAILLLSLFSTQVAGWFALTTRVVAAPSAVVGNAVSHVYFEKAARVARSEPGALRALYLNALKKMSVVGVLPLLAVGGVAPLVFRYVFGAEWSESGVYVLILALPFAVHFVVTPLNQMLNVLRREDLLLAWNGLRFALVGGAMLGGYAVWGGARAVIACYGAATVASYLALVGMTVRALPTTSEG